MFQPANKHSTSIDIVRDMYTDMYTDMYDNYYYNNFYWAVTVLEKTKVYALESRTGRVCIYKPYFNHSVRPFLKI